MSLFSPRARRLAVIAIALVAQATSLHAVNETAEAMLTPVALPGVRTTVRWNDLTAPSGNPSSGSGTITVNSPGFLGSYGYYSHSGPYSLTASTAAFPANGAKTVVLQIVGMLVVDSGLNLDYTVEDHLAFQGGPVLTYTHAGGTGILSPIASGTRGDPVGGEGGGFEGDYHTFTWQWDLGALDPGITITQLSIRAPLVVHSSTIGVQIDTGDTFSQVVGEPALTALEQWRLEKFLSAENAGDGADDNDYDGDGLPNLLEYALGRDPKIPDSAPATTLSRNAAGTRLVLGFNRIADPTLTYIVEAKNDLGDATWTDITPPSLAVAPAGPILVEDVQTIAASPRRFLRLRVEAN